MRTINIVTKPAAREGFFGTVATGYGTENTYLLGTSLNLFKNESRLTLTGLNNNISTHSLSANPSYSGASNTFDGVTKPSALGLDYSNTWSDIVAVSSSYSFNHTINKFSQARTREYAQYANDEKVFSNNRENNGISGNHMFYTRLDYEINERNSILIRTRGYLLQYNGSSHWLSRTWNDEDPIVQLEADSRTDSTYFYLDNDIIYRHRFRKAGRTINIGLGNSYNANKDDRAHFSKDIYHPEDNNRTNRQYHKSKEKDVSWETNFAYTEPFGVYGQVELGHRVENRRHDLDRKFYCSGDGVLEEDTQFQEDFSNASKSSYLTQKTSVGYSYNNDVLYFQVGGAFQQARLKDDQQFPFTSTLDRSFTSYLPSARLRYKFSESNNLELHYDTWTNTPSASQLQGEIHWQNPLLLKIGNPGLQQAFYNWFRARYRAHNLEKDHHFYASVEATSASQEIVYGIMTDGYLEEISNGIILLPDAQLVRSENLQGGRNFRTYVSYGQPLGFIRANLNLHGSISHSRRPGIINGYMNFFNTNTYGMGALISSNISERIDFNFSTHSSYRVFRNTMLPKANKNFLSQRTRIWYNWIFGENFVYRTSINHQFSSGHVESYSGHTFHWNMSLGKKLFPNRLGELSVRAYDLLKQQNSVSRNITALYIEDVESNVLERYFYANLYL
ncbi:outer membrane beta-barrel protein [Pontibacter beigongshangensis]|uniref:outer membrane beta-barrel protein n=1 Tax=Pontibacter beigongshangensis TaxID=2574733 RepID=UPI00164FC88C|nr:outer membrane beta-barrel protein [Pontibacter beigongshangensis]